LFRECAEKSYGSLPLMKPLR